MDASHVRSDAGGARRIELILHQLESLPTLSAIAVRLLELTAADDSEAREVIELIASDPSLAARVLKLCRCSPRGRAANVQSVERAVLLLGFDAVRSAVLSVQVFNVLNGTKSAGGEVRDASTSFSPDLFWQHSVAVGTACEMIVTRSQLRHAVKQGDAFLAGLLHDLGMLILHVVLPRSFDRVCELADTHGLSVDAAAAQVLGIDTHTAGKRLAEHWQLPESFAEVMWLHGQPFASLPDGEHKRLIGLVSLADALVRRQHIAPIGHRPRNENLAAMAEELGVEPSVLDEIGNELADEVAARAEGFGLNFQHSEQLLLQSLSRANEVLGRINHTLQGRAQAARGMAKTLSAIAEFHDDKEGGASVISVLGRIVSSAAKTFGGAAFWALYQARAEQPWNFLKFGEDGRLQASAELTRPRHAPPAQLAADSQVSAEVLALLPQIRQHLGKSVDAKSVHLLSLPCPFGASAALLHNCPQGGLEQKAQFDALARTWGAALAAAIQHEDAASLSERLAHSNRELLEAQESLARNRTLAAVGEIAAGAAHEMNNPLTVISGRAQLLLSRLVDPAQREMAEQVVFQSNRLSGIITALRMFAEPTAPNVKPVDLGELVMRVVQEVQPRGVRNRVKIDTILSSVPALVFTDPDHVSGALSELVRNAIEAEGSSQIEVRVHTDRMGNRLVITVTDDGKGLSPKALKHAFDPFFSEKPAGRQPGLGLPQARRLIEALEGEVRVENREGGGGAVATLSFPVRHAGEARPSGTQEEKRRRAA
jgi:signal transduction histidine kinase/HD-like signal output (HDOD) protein